jgi:Family of unknown function (DUF6412)
MLLWGFWALVAFQSPAPGSAHLVLGLAVVAAALLVVLAAAGVPAPAPSRSSGVNPRGARDATSRPLPRLFDPDAAGRPRPRAPSAHPAAA